MEQFPSNSQRSKPVANEQPREKVERIVTSDVIQRKKPLGRRFAEAFGGGDARGTVFYVVAEILVPAAKDMAADAVSQGFERLIFGEARYSRRSSSRTTARPGGYTNYSRMSSPSTAPVREEPRGMSRRGRANHEFDEIILATRVEAEAVIDRLLDLIQRYDVATVSDLYDLAGITSSYTDAKWGWDDLSGAGVRRVGGGGYLLDLPPTKAVD